MSNIYKKFKIQALAVFAKFKGSISIILIAALVVLIAFEIFVLKSAIATVVNIAKANPAVQASQLVRIDFAAYDKIVQRIGGASNYNPSPAIFEDPFGVKAEPKTQK